MFEILAPKIHRQLTFVINCGRMVRIGIFLKKKKAKWWGRRKKESMAIEPYKPIILFNGTKAKSAEPDQTSHNVLSNQGLHGLLTDFFFIKFE